jgi:hypothetical protein
MRELCEPSPEEARIFYWSAAYSRRAQDAIAWRDAWVLLLVPIIGGSFVFSFAAPAGSTQWATPTRDNEFF